MAANRADALLVNLELLRSPGLAPLVIASWARRDPELQDFSFDTAEINVREPVESITRRILERAPRLVGFSCYVWNQTANRAVARRLKELEPELKIVFGGPEIATAARRELERLPQLDYACTGEGEETFRLLARALFRGDIALADVPGLAYRAGGAVSVGVEAKLIDVAETVSPYLSGAADGAGTACCFVESSRGCPFTCTFCDWGPRTVRFFPEARLEAEFARLAGKTPKIILTDADLMMNRPRCLRIMESFLRATAGTPCQLGFEGNPLFLVPEIVSVIARAPGKFRVALGLQSVRDEVLKNVERTFDRPRVERNLADLRARAPGAHFLFSTIYGLPGDDLEGLRETVDWCLRQSPVFVRINHPLILPGTELQKQAIRAGMTYQLDPPHQLLAGSGMSTSALCDAREFAAYVEFLTSFPTLYAELLDAASTRAGEPLAYVRLVEAWIVALKDSRVELPGSARWRKIDDRPVQNSLRETEDLVKTDDLLLATITHVTRRAVERWRAAAVIALFFFTPHARAQPPAPLVVVPGAGVSAAANEFSGRLADLGLVRRSTDAFILETFRTWGKWPGKDSESTLTARRESTLLRLKGWPLLGPKEASGRQDLQLARLMFLYSGDAAYPGMITRRFEIPENLQPAFDDSGPTGSKIAWLYATKNLSYGAGSDDLAAYRVALAFLYCPEASRLFQIEVFFPRGEFTRSKALAELASLACGP